MPRGKKAPVQEGSAHLHGANSKESTKPASEHHGAKGHLLEGIVAGLPKKTMPPVIDGICRGVPKYTPSINDKTTMHVGASATRDDRASFGSGLFPSGKVGH